MIIEHVIFGVAPERQAEFEAAFEQAKAYIASAEGFHSVSLSRGHEEPDHYLLLVEWDSVEAHMEGFRGSEAFAQWAALLGDFRVPIDPLSHFQEIARA